MTAYCDTSFFIRGLFPNRDRAKAIEVAGELEGRLGCVPITCFTRFECVQAIRFESWRNRNDRSKGLSQSQTESALNLFLAEIGSSFEVQSVDWEMAIVKAEELTRSTPEQGWRTVDLLHVATAVTLGVEEFYSFDVQQNNLAAAQGMQTPLVAA